MLFPYWPKIFFTAVFFVMIVVISPEVRRPRSFNLMAFSLYSLGMAYQEVKIYFGMPITMHLMTQTFLLRLSWFVISLLVLIISFALWARKPKERQPEKAQSDVARITSRYDL